MAGLVLGGISRISPLLLFSRWQVHLRKREQMEGIRNNCVLLEKFWFFLFLNHVEPVILWQGSRGMTVH